MLKNLYDESLLEAIDSLNNTAGTNNIDYRSCEIIYEKLIYGRKLIETLPDYALTSRRILSVADDLMTPEVLKAIDDYYIKHSLIEVIRELAIKTRIYGMAVLYVGSYSGNTSDMLKPEELKKGVFFNVLSPLQFAGTMTELDPLSPYFLKPRLNSIRINGIGNPVAVTNGDRAIVHQHTVNLPYQYTMASMGFWGRSMWINMGTTMVVLSRLMHTFNRYATYGASVHVKDTNSMIGQSSSGSYNMAREASLREIQNALDATGIVMTSEVGDVKAVGVNGAIEAVQVWESLNKLLEMGSYDTPISLLLSQTFNNGLSEGKEDVKTAEIALQTYLNKLRHVFNFIDKYVLELAWTDEFLESVKSKVKDTKPAWDNDIALIRRNLINSFTYKFSPVFKDDQKDTAIAVGHKVDALAKAVDLVNVNSNGEERLTTGTLEATIKNTVEQT